MTSGVTALVFKPSEEGEPALPDLQVRCHSSSAPNYIAMEVDHSPWSFAPDRSSMEELVFTFEGLYQGLTRMASSVSSSSAPRRRRHAWLAVAGVCALLLALGGLYFIAAEPGGTAPLMEASTVATPCPVATEMEVSASDISFASTQDGGPVVPSRPMPKLPYKGQRRPPCVPEVEVEIIGACWIPHKLEAPCPKELHEHQGKCYVPNMVAPAPPSSLGK